MTIKQYAESRGITYEAARATIQRHSEELCDHIYKKGRTRLLDDDAVAMLDNWRRENPIVVQIADNSARLAELEQENATLKSKIIALQDSLLQAQERTAQLQEDKILLLQEQAAAQAAEAAEEANKRPWWHFWHKT